MPPAISDEEISDVEVTRGTSSRSGRGKNGVKYTEPEPLELEDDEGMADSKGVRNGNAKDEEEDEEDGDDGEEDGDEPEEYVVEKILSHRWEKATQELKFEVKWEGYEKKSDRTWEPEENLLHTSILQEYYAAHGGKEKMLEEVKQALKNKKRGRNGADTPTSTSKRPRKNGQHPAESTPPATAKQATWKPPAGSWEDEIDDLDACEDEESGKLMVYLTWKNGHKTQHETSVIYKRCPQKMLQFYERHVRIIKKDPAEEVDDAIY